MKATRQKCGEPANTPACLDVPGAEWGLAGLRVHDGTSLSVLGRAPAAGLVVQAGDSVLRVPVQPGAHHVTAAGRDYGDHGTE